MPLGKELDIEQELANWSLWSRSRRRPGHCASIEGHYRHPRHRVTNPGVAIDVNSALEVERGLQQVPRQHQAALIYHYSWFSSSQFICRRLGLQHRAWDQFLQDARTMLANILLKSGKWRISSADNSDPSTS